MTFNVWQSIAESALNYIFISVISASNQKQTVTDMKTDLRTTKEDIMSELKDSRKDLQMQIEDLKLSLSEIKKEIKAE